MDGRANERVHDCFDYALYYYYTGIGPGYVSLMKWRFEKGCRVRSRTIPLDGYQGYLFSCGIFGFMTTHDDMRAGQDHVSWLIWPCGSAHLARLHFEVLFDNKLYFENKPP